MNANLRHNGCDTLMLGFDYELRRRGFAGNSCQIVLELAAPIDPARLEARLAALTRQHLILSARPARGLTPRWKPTSAASRVRVHAKAANLPQELFNEPLDIHRGDLIRFDLIERTVILTWAHALMDAKSAEYFLALVGDDNVLAPGPGEDWYARRGCRAGGLRARGRQAWRELDRLEKFKTALPVSLATRRPPTALSLKYQVVTLSREESACVRARAARLCGFLGDSNFHMRMIKHELGGEICSLFFGDTAAVDSALKHFLGAAIEKFSHAPAVTLPPGVGVVFYRFRDQLQFTLVHADGTLTNNEAAEFAARLRERLLNP